jgi:hypothetical protein
MRGRHHAGKEKDTPSGLYRNTKARIAGPSNVDLLSHGSFAADAGPRLLS